MYIELGALVHKAQTDLILEALGNHLAVAVAFVAGGRSNDLFEKKEFGDYGEASIITVIADESSAAEILDLLHSVSGLATSAEGVVFSGKSIARCSLPAA
jgi:hypothetical protein